MNMLGFSIQILIPLNLQNFSCIKQNDLHLLEKNLNINFVKNILFQEIEIKDVIFNNKFMTKGFNICLYNTGRKGGRGHLTG